jgi:hypothetical protein
VPFTSQLTFSALSFLAASLSRSRFLRCLSRPFSLARAFVASSCAVLADVLCKLERDSGRCDGLPAVAVSPEAVERGLLFFLVGVG